MADLSLEKPERINWSSLRKVFSASETLTLRERMKIWLRGQKDARKGKIHIKDNNLDSVWCLALASEANSRILEEWSLRDDQAFRLKAFIDQSLKKLEYLRDEHTQLLADRHRDETMMHQLNEAADRDVTEHMSQRRRVARQRNLNIRYDERARALRAEIAKTELDMIPRLEDYRNAKQVALSNEAAIRHEYLARLAIYAYSVSDYYRLPEDIINDSALDDTPRAQHEELFRSYEFDAGNGSTQATGGEA